MIEVDLQRLADHGSCRSVRQVHSRCTLSDLIAATKDSIQ